MRISGAAGSALRISVLYRLEKASEQKQLDEEIPSSTRKLLPKPECTGLRTRETPPTVSFSLITWILAHRGLTHVILRKLPVGFPLFTDRADSPGWPPMAPMVAKDSAAQLIVLILFRYVYSLAMSSLLPNCA